MKRRKKMMATYMTVAEQNKSSRQEACNCPPKRIKPMKKDKIGERVAALQQLVAPFGKSDTASVLEEVIAYIKFLHDQLQILSTPYLSSSSNGKLQWGERSNGVLRSRGLCLMPVDATVLIFTESNGADIWAPFSK